MSKFRIRPMSSKTEYEAYLASVSEKQILSGQASSWQMEQFIEQNTDKIVIDKTNRTIKFLGQFDVVINDYPHLLYLDKILNQDGFFANGLPPIEYV